MLAVEVRHAAIMSKHLAGLFDRAADEFRR